MHLALHCLALLTLFAAPINAAVRTDVPIKQLPDGRLQIGLVALNSKAKTISFPAAVNMRTGLVEYAVVTASGKVHESVFKTEAEPFHIHTGMLLLGARLQTNTDSTVFFDPKREIPGPALKIEVITQGPNARTNQIDHFLRNAQEKTPRPGQIPFWIYNGSRFSDGTFLAQREGSIVSLIADPAALINNPRQDRENDELWSANAAEVPPLDGAVEIRFTLSDRP